jgi:hypothetical protein
VEGPAFIDRVPPLSLPPSERQDGDVYPSLDPPRRKNHSREDGPVPAAGPNVRPTKPALNARTYVTSEPCEGRVTISATRISQLMPVPLSISDFKMTLAVCETRYEDAYLLYDHTGQICHELRTHLPGVKVVAPAPSQTTGTFELGFFGLEIGASRLTTNKPDGKLEQFAAACKNFFDSVTRNLDVKVFTRIGLRTMFRKDFKELDEAKAAFTSLRLISLKPAQRFGAATEPHELYLRWEGKDTGVTWRLKAESGKIDVILPPELESEKPELHKAFNGLVLDVDYYTVAPVDRSQWEPTEWIPNAVRTIRRDTDAILEG